MTQDGFLRLVAPRPILTRSAASSDAVAASDVPAWCTQGPLDHAMGSMTVGGYSPRGGHIAT